MILIFGGSFQGKRDFTKTKFNITEKDIFTCTTDEINYDSAAIDDFEVFVHDLLRNGGDPKKWLQENQDNLKSKIIITVDISCGIVPLDSFDRKYRETLGEMNTYLAKISDEVYRVFCGIGTKLV